jgi:hypothetical protein
MKEYTKKRLKNQLRIHWKWLKNLKYIELYDYIVPLIENNEKK